MMHFCYKQSCFRSKVTIQLDANFQIQIIAHGNNLRNVKLRALEREIFLETPRTIIFQINDHVSEEIFKIVHSTKAHKFKSLLTMSARFKMKTFRNCFVEFSIWFFTHAEKTSRNLLIFTQS